MSRFVVRWLGGTLFIMIVLTVSRGLAEHPRWAPMAPQPTAKTNRNSHTSRSYRGRSGAHTRGSQCAGVGGQRSQNAVSDRSTTSPGQAAAPQRQAAVVAPQ
jgi:hypothetical protein